MKAAIQVSSYKTPYWTQSSFKEESKSLFAPGSNCHSGSLFKSTVSPFLAIKEAERQVLCLLWLSMILVLLLPNCLLLLPLSLLLMLRMKELGNKFQISEQ